MCTHSLVARECLLVALLLCAQTTTVTAPRFVLEEILMPHGMNRSRHPSSPAWVGAPHPPPTHVLLYDMPVHSCTAAHYCIRCLGAILDYFVNTGNKMGYCDSSRAMTGLYMYTSIAVAYSTHPDFEMPVDVESVSIRPCYVHLNWPLLG